MKIVIVSGVAGGAGFAARARRLNESAEIILLERGGVCIFCELRITIFICNAVALYGASSRFNLLELLKAKPANPEQLDVNSFRLPARFGIVQDSYNADSDASTVRMDPP